MRKNGGCDAFTTLPLVSCRYLTVTASNSCSMTSYSIYDCSVVDYFTALGKQGHILLINGLTTIRLYRLQTRRTPANARLAACHDERQSNINAIPAVLNKKPLSIHALPRPRAMPMPCSSSPARSHCSSSPQCSTHSRSSSCPCYAACCSSCCASERAAPHRGRAGAGRSLSQRGSEYPSD
jgi:hypothetical protein